MGLTESCCGGPRSVTSRRFRSDSDGDDDVDSSSSEVVQKKIEEKTTTISSRTIRKIQAKEEVKKRNLTPPPGISMIHENAFTPKTLISPPKIHTKKEEPPPKTSSTPPPKMPTKKNEPEIKKSPKEIDPKEILFRNIQEAQDGKRPELLAIKDAFNEIRSKDIVRSASMGYMFPVHASCRFTKKSSRQFCLQDFKAFGVYLSYSKQFRENLKTACDLLRSKLSSMHESELFEDEDKLIHLFESVTLYILAGAVIFRMIVDKTNKKKKGKTKKIAEKTKPESRTKLDKETWKKSCKNLVKDMKSFGDCFQAMQHLLKEKAFGGKLCARVVDEIVVYEGYHDFIHFRTLHDVKKYIQLPSKSKTSEEETDDIVGDLLTESESAVPRESFVHGQFNNVDYKHCWLSTSFQSLWHSNVFHVAFEKYVVRSIDNMDDKGMGTLKPGSVTRGLMETWKMYRKANGHSTVSPSAMASVWGNDHGDPVDCLNDISSRKAKLEPKQLSHLGLVLFGKGPHRGHGVVCTYVSKVGKLRAQTAWMSLHKSYKTRALLILQVPITLGMKSLLEFFNSFEPVYDQKGCENDSHMGDNGHRLVSVICYLKEAEHYVCFCRRKEVPSRWRLFNDIPETMYESTKHCNDLLTSAGGDIDLVRSTLKIYDLLPTVFVFESRKLFAKSMKNFDSGKLKGDDKNCIVS